jgi:hypothetical protein
MRSATSTILRFLSIAFFAQFLAGNLLALSLALHQQVLGTVNDAPDF